MELKSVFERFVRGDAKNVRITDNVLDSKYRFMYNHRGQMIEKKEPIIKPIFPAVPPIKNQVLNLYELVDGIQKIEDRFNGDYQKEVLKSHYDMIIDYCNHLKKKLEDQE